MIEYTRTGGFAGQEDRLTIQSDGAVQFTSKISGNLVQNIKSKLKPDAVQKLVSLFNEVDFFSFENNYKAMLPVIDHVVYTITFSHKDRAKTVTTETEAKSPRGFRLIQTELEEVIAKLISD